MYSFHYDVETGGVILDEVQSTIRGAEVRPVFAPELDMYGFDDYYIYNNQSDEPYMWARQNCYIYRGQEIAKVKFDKETLTPELILNNSNIRNEKLELQPINVKEMIAKNVVLLGRLEKMTADHITERCAEYKKYVDVIHVAYSGGKDSAALLYVVKKALQSQDYIVIFSDTTMEVPDTEETVRREQEICREEGIRFYISAAPARAEELWPVFGPPSRRLRWCHLVHKVMPARVSLREIIGKNKYIAVDIIGVRRSESLRRSTYTMENYNVYKDGQYNFFPILEWSTLEVWLYHFFKNIHINTAYKKGAVRAGCVLCPQASPKNYWIYNHWWHDDVSKFTDIIKDTNIYKDDEVKLEKYISKVAWGMRFNGEWLVLDDETRYKEQITSDRVIITIINPKTDWREWVKTVGCLPFNFSIKYIEDGYIVSFPRSKYRSKVKQLKAVFRRAAVCVNCGVCAGLCNKGCITFDGGQVRISNCIHCGKCYDQLWGCVRFNSIRDNDKFQIEHIEM